MFEKAVGDRVGNEGEQATPEFKLNSPGPPHARRHHSHTIYSIEAEWVVVWFRQTRRVSGVGLPQPTLNRRRSVTRASGSPPVRKIQLGLHNPRLYTCVCLVVDASSSLHSVLFGVLEPCLGGRADVRRLRHVLHVLKFLAKHFDHLLEISIYRSIIQEQLTPHSSRDSFKKNTAVYEPPGLV